MAKSIYTQTELKQFKKAKDSGYDMEIFHNPNKAKIWNSPSVNQLSKIPNLYEQEDKKEKKVYMKLFTPDRTYYITEFDKKSGDFYGYLNISGGENEWGYTNINELKKSVAQSRGLYYLDRDIHFEPTKVSDLKKTGEIKERL